MSDSVISCLSISAVAFVVGVILYKIFIPILRKVKLGQKILEIGPSWHKSKEGTPNLGGLFFIIATAVAVVFGLFLIDPAFSDNTEVNITSKMLTLFGLALSQGLIGFIDDYVKLFKKRNKGLSSTQKLILQVITAAAYLFVNSYFNGYNTSVATPFGELELGFFYYVLMLLAIVYIINCANLTDGIDGLAGSIAFIISFMFICLGLEKFECEMYIPASALVGALLAFLVFNFHPAKIFMGDTGSLFLGGFLVGLAMLTDNEFVLIPMSLIWIIEGLSVVIQVASFKLTGKRVFKMAPIHHHFEKCGWSEVKIVAVFSIITVASCVLSAYLMIIR